MKASLLVVFSVLFFSACSNTPMLPKMDHAEPFMIEYEGIIHKGIKGYFVTHPMMQTMQEGLINRRINQNICADISAKQ